MKKSKLRLRTETVRDLTAVRLGSVGGGYGEEDAPSTPGRTCNVHGEVTAIENGCVVK